MSCRSCKKAGWCSCQETEHRRALSKIGRPYVTAEESERMMLLRAQGLNYREVGLIVNRVKSTVWQACR